MIGAGKFDPDRLIAVVAGEMTGDEFAIYWMICTLILSRGTAVPAQATIAKLRSLLKIHGKSVSTAIDRLLSTGHLIAQNGAFMTDFCEPQAAAAAPSWPEFAEPSPPPPPPPQPVKPMAPVIKLPPPRIVAAAPQPRSKSNGHDLPNLDLFAGIMPVPPPAQSIVEQQRQTETEFASWYKIYPLHRAPDAALRAFAKARQKASLEDLTAGAVRYAKEVADYTDRHLIAHPATWLNRGSWKDEEAPSNVMPFGRAWS